MASSLGLPPKRGRPRRDEKNKAILLKETSFVIWNEVKTELGFKSKSNNEFAAFLLAKCGDDDKISDTSSESDAKRKKPAGKGKRSLIFHSTPTSKPVRSETVEMGMSGLSVSPIATERNVSLVTQSEDAPNIEDQLNESTLLKAVSKVNPLYATVLGNPFECQEMDESSDSSSDGFDESSEESTEYRSDEETMSLYDDSSTKTAFETLLDFADNSSLENSQTAHSSVTVPREQLVEGGNGELNGQPQEKVTKKANEQLIDGSSGEPGEQPQEEAAEEPNDEDACVKLKEKLSEVFEELVNYDDELANYVGMANKERVIVEMNKVLDLLQGKCQGEGCSGERKVIRRNVEGGVLSVVYGCSKGHTGVWHSSSVLTEKRGQKVFLTTVLLSAAILLTGNNFDKVELMAKMLRLAFVSSATFNRILSLHAVPVVKELWKKMKDRIWQTIKDENLVLCGDARMDSPGFSAKYCAYILMDHYLSIITDLEVVDKREAGGTSTVMEKMALKRLLERTIENLKLMELVTDASSSIIKLVRDTKEQNAETMANFFHSLDIWHKSCKLTAKLSSTAKTRGCEGIKQWIEPVRNHFWHCAENCDGDEKALKDMWLGVMHHVCNEHEWSDGQCSHGPLTSLEEGKEYLAKESKAAQAMRDVIYDSQWLNSLKFYVFFRHTSKLESFNSMVLKYAPKRIGFAYEIFLARILLAILDHNFHAFRELVEGRFKKVYSKRSKNWHVLPVKVEKQYKYWDILLSNILKRRADDDKCIARHVEVSATNPQNLAPTIAMREPPATKDLVEAKLSRFKSKK